MNDPLQKLGFERHAQTVLQVVIAALLVWVGGEIVTLGKGVTRLEAQTVQTSKEISEMKAEIVVLRGQITTAALAAATAAAAATSATQRAQK